MSERKTTTDRTVHGSRLRWPRIATLAMVLLIHLVFLAFLLAPATTWHWSASQAPALVPDALRIRLLSPRPRPVETSRPATPRTLRQAPVAHMAQPPTPAALSTRATAQTTPSPPAPRAIDSLIVSEPPSYVTGGGRLSSPDYGNQNVRVPGSDAPVRGMPVFRMADPRMQGVAGVIRVIGGATGAIDPHCLKLDAENGMSARERIADHINVDDAQSAAIAARYGCPDPLKPGAAMYYFTPQRRDVGAH